MVISWFDAHTKLKYREIFFFKFLGYIYVIVHSFKGQKLFQQLLT